MKTLKTLSLILVLSSCAVTDMPQPMRYSSGGHKLPYNYKNDIKNPSTLKVSAPKKKPDNVHAL